MLPGKTSFIWLLMALVVIVGMYPVAARDFAVEVPYQKGRYFLEWKQLDQAIIKLEKARKIDSSHIGTRILLARAYVLKSRETANPPTRLELLLKARDLGGGAAAEPVLAADLCRAYRGTAAAEQNPERKREFLEEALRLAPANRVDTVLTEMRTVADSTGRYDRLLVHLHHYYRLNQSPVRRHLLAECALAAAEAARTLFASIRLLKTVIAVEPRQARAWKLLGQAHVDLARTVPEGEERIQVLEQALKYDPENQAAGDGIFLNCLAMAAISMEPADKRRWYRKALEIKPGDKTAVDGLVKATIQLADGLENEHKQLELLEETLDMKPMVEAYYLLAEIHGKRGDHLARIKLLRLALKHDPQFHKARTALTESYFQMALRAHLLSESAHWYYMSFSFHPQNVQALYNYGHLLQKKKMIDEAIIKYHEVLALDSSFAPAYLNLGWLYWKNKGNLKQALENFKSYSMLDSYSPTGLKVKTWVKELEREYRLRQLSR